MLSQFPETVVHAPLVSAHLVPSNVIWAPGTGGRELRRQALQRPCCPAARIMRIQDGRWQCGCCGSFWTVSHTGRILAWASLDQQVGVDIERVRESPCALRMLARRVGLSDPQLAHWVMAEAVLKAVGMASSVSGLDGLWMPDELGTETVINVQHERVGLVKAWYRDLSGLLLAVAIVPN